LPVAESARFWRARAVPEIPKHQASSSSSSRSRLARHPYIEGARGFPARPLRRSSPPAFSVRDAPAVRVVARRRFRRGSAARAGSVIDRSPYPQGAWSKFGREPRDPPPFRSPATSTRSVSLRLTSAYSEEQCLPCHPRHCRSMCLCSASSRRSDRNCRLQIGWRCCDRPCRSG
jgi:hypothetical protein